MASKKLVDLDPDMQQAAQKVALICEEAGIDLLIYCTLRPLEEQAKLYRQSRSRPTIKKKSDSLIDRGFGYLASILESVGAQQGPHVTNAGPGESFHNYGLAFDAVPMLGGKCCWKYAHHKPLWEGYGEAVRQAGLKWAGEWTSFREYPHAQLHEGGNPLRFYEPDVLRGVLEKNGLLTKLSGGE